MERLDRARPKGQVALGAALVSGLAAYAWFATRPEMAVLIGTTPVSQRVPAHYQASIFPAFGAFIAALGYDLITRSGPWRARSVVLGVCSASAVLRLLGLLPLSGHTLFAAALIGHELTAAPLARTPLGLFLASASLLLTTCYKLGVWGDAGWFFASLAIGAAVGAGVNRFGRLSV